MRKYTIVLFYVPILLVHYICYHSIDTYTATCFGPQVAILSSIDTFGEKGLQNTCPGVNIWKAKRIDM